MTTDPHALNQPGLEAEPLHVAGREARPWLAMLEEARKTFRDYQDRADNIDKLYSDLGYLANGNRDREFALFWANVQVLGPSIYSRPPVPVVVPRFKDRRPLYRMASELLERCAIVAFELADIDHTMLLVRDDLTISARGVAWVRLHDEDGKRKVCPEHIDRRDFMHEPARNWGEVGWVARRAWMTREAARKRFKELADEITFAERHDDKELGGTDDVQQAGVWEIWHKRLKRVVWVSEDCDVILDSDEPHLKLEGFFPCPRPAYATTQRRSLIPVPDMVFYRDQLEEINALTRRIHALSEALKVKGFYAAGSSDIGDAVETALQSNDDRKTMVPVANWAAMVSGAGSDPIVWLPIDMVATTIQTCVSLRKELIDDVYQITGLSDIMRGSTDANETLGAQELKSQYGSVRIRDRQAELVRVARDLVRIVAEIMAENFDTKTLVEMSQLEIPTNADVKREAKALQMQAMEQLKQQAQQDPEFMQRAEQDLQFVEQMAAQAMQQMQAQLQPQIDKLMEKPTVEKVAAFLKDQRLRPFVLDIETDSTITPDENRQKELANEFIAAVGGAIGQAAPVIQTLPQLAPVFSDMLKFIAGQYRAGRELEGTIDEFAENMKQMAAQPQGNPEADAAKAQAEAEQAKLQGEMQMKQAEAQARQQEAQQKAEMEGAKLQAEMEAKAADMQMRQHESQAKLEADAQTAQLTIQTLQAKAVADGQTHEQAMQKGALELEKLRVEIERIQVQSAAAEKPAEAKANQPKTEAA